MIKVTGTITVIEGYDAIRVFVEAVWRRHGKPGDQIEFLLGGMKMGRRGVNRPGNAAGLAGTVQMVVSAGPCKTATDR